MKAVAHGMTPYSFRKGIASAPQFDTTRVSFVSLTVVKTYMKRNIMNDMDMKWGSSDGETGNLEEMWEDDDDIDDDDVDVVAPPPLLPPAAVDSAVNAADDDDDAAYLSRAASIMSPMPPPPPFAVATSTLTLPPPSRSIVISKEAPSA